MLGNLTVITKFEIEISCIDNGTLVSRQRQPLLCKWLDLGSTTCTEVYNSVNGIKTFIHNFHNLNDLPINNPILMVLESFNQLIKLLPVCSGCNWVASLKDMKNVPLFLFSSDVTLPWWLQKPKRDSTVQPNIQKIRVRVSFCTLPCTHTLSWFMYVFDITWDPPGEGSHYNHWPMTPQRAVAVNNSNNNTLTYCTHHAAEYFSRQLRCRSPTSTSDYWWQVQSRWTCQSVCESITHKLISSSEQKTTQHTNTFPVHTVEDIIAAFGLNDIKIMPINGIPTLQISKPSSKPARRTPQCQHENQALCKEQLQFSLPHRTPFRVCNMVLIHSLHSTHRSRRHSQSCQPTWQVHRNCQAPIHIDLPYNSTVLQGQLPVSWHSPPWQLVLSAELYFSKKLSGLRLSTCHKSDFADFSPSHTLPPLSTPPDAGPTTYLPPPWRLHTALSTLPAAPETSTPCLEALPMRVWRVAATAATCLA